MDFDFSSEKPKKEEYQFGSHDHSLNADGLSPQGSQGLSTSDDFEHISGDKLLDTDYDLLGSSMINAPPAENLSSSTAKSNILDGFSFTEPKYDDFGFDSSPKFGTPAHQKTSTIDFMQAERAEPPPLPKHAPLIPSAPAPSSLLDEIEDDYLNPYATKKVSEPVAASKPWDNKDSDEEFDNRSHSPDPFQKAHKTFDSDAWAQPEAPPPIKPLEPVKPVEKPVAKPLEPEVIIKPAPVQPVPKKEEKPVEIPKPKVEEVKPAKKPEPINKSKEQLTTAEEMFCKIGLGE